MKLTTVAVLACLVAVVASAQYEHHPAIDSLYEDAVQESVQGALAQRGSLRPKRSLILLKKKLLLGALGLKAATAAKAAAVGAVLLKAKPKSVHEVHIQTGHAIHPTWDLEVHRFG